MDEAQFLVGDAVRKRSGYPFAGIVVAAFPTLAGLIRYVVEHDTEHGMLHIFSSAQLEARR